MNQAALLCGSIHPSPTVLKSGAWDILPDTVSLGAFSMCQLNTIRLPFLEAMPANRRLCLPLLQKLFNYESSFTVIFFKKKEKLYFAP